ncbi:schlafen family member 13 [Plakobranchus ocellatus]|uniref:Schlafen family member 13 n=1 Tax=Plakobranchus ocellatus TaxID=259542 RepID=A0AAV4BW62_9GAST|nr:schlafen family member 13 [Plakobranchus ocellatus]
MSATLQIYNHSHEYGDILVSCPVYISKGIHQRENIAVLQHVCALLNCGGGILVMENMDFNQGTQSKSLDDWWSGMECNFATILSGDDICNYLDFVGNFDDPHLYLFVKSADHLCTIDYHCRLPTDTATHSVTYSSAVKLCTRSGTSKPLSLLPAIPTTFVSGRTEETLKQEGKQIQFKNLSANSKNSKTLPDKVVYYSSKYISAFANHEGGHIYFGIEDTSASVIGEQITAADEIKMTVFMENKMKAMIWKDTNFTPVKGTHWDIQFFPVLNSPHRQRRRIIVISVSKIFGGVFTNCPESYFITAGHSGNNRYSSRKLSFDEWKTELLYQSRDIKSLRSRFIKLNLMTPQSRLVFSLPHTLEASREKVIHLSHTFNIHPHSTLSYIKNEKVKMYLGKLCEEFVGENHLVLSLDVWGLELDMSSKPKTVEASVAVLSVKRGLHVVCLADHLTETKMEWSFVVNLAINLKQVLVKHGGCNRHLGFQCHVIDLSSPECMDLFKVSSSHRIYPSTYTIHEETMNNILDSLTISLASYKPFSHSSLQSETDHYYLLTCDQLELLWTHHLTKELWVHGPPGCGKTIAAMEMMRILRQRGCRTDEVLYVAENLLLCAYVRSFDLSLVVSRRELMQDSLDQCGFTQKYRFVKNVIVDEAQNFKDRDGDWYSLLEKLAHQNCKDSLEINCGYFWVFMDYAQKVHKFRAGLPNLIGKNNFMLREISRNTREIYTYAKKFMDAPSEGNAEFDGFSGVSTDSPYHLGHDYSSGNAVHVVKCNKSTLDTMLGQILKQYGGADLGNVAILASKKTEARQIEQSIKAEQLMAEEKLNDFNSPVASSSGLSDSNSSSAFCISSDEKCVAGSQPDRDYEKDMLVDGDNINQNQPLPSKENSLVLASSDSSKSPFVSTVREFSGLDRPVIIGVDPHTNQNHADLDKFLLNLITRAKDQLIILTTSDELLKKLSIQS